MSAARDGWTERNLDYIESLILVDGKHLYGIQFPNARNGRSRLLFQDGLLYVDARGPGLYIFRDTELLRFEEGTIHNEEYSKLEKIFTDEADHTDGQYTYSYSEKDNNLSRTGSEGTDVILQFPKKKLTDYFWLLIVLIMLLAKRYLWDRADSSPTACKGEHLPGTD